MTKNKHSGLGNGLASLFNNTCFEQDIYTNGKDIINIDVSKIDPNPYQPRKDFDEIQRKSNQKYFKGF